LTIWWSVPTHYLTIEFLRQRLIEAPRPDLAKPVWVGGFFVSEPSRLGDALDVVLGLGLVVGVAQRLKVLVFV
jgi:hypothetical protein